MTDNIVPAIVEGARLVTNLQRDKARYDYLSSSYGTRKTTIGPVTCEEETVPTVELNNYVKRSEVEGETGHVLVVEHKEHLEKKRVPAVPPTAEEIAQEREHKKFLAKIWGGVVAVGVVVVGVVIVFERRQSPPALQQAREEVPS